MSLPTHATTYQLTREQVSGQQPTSDRDDALRALAAAGIPAAVETDGAIRGVLTVDPRRFKSLPGAPIAPRQAFEVNMPGTLRFADPSPLSQLGELPFLEPTSMTRLTERLVKAWAQRVQLIEQAVLIARGRAPNAQLYGDPWRIEGELPFRHHVIRMMFSTRGDRACVCSIDGRPVDRAPAKRKILPVDPHLNDQFWEALLADAVTQAQPCLGPPVVNREERQLSIDLASKDLAARPTVELPSSLPVATVVSPPPRLPPPRTRPKTDPHLQSPMDPTTPTSLPRPHLASNPRSLALMVDDADVLVSVDLSTTETP